MSRRLKNFARRACFHDPTCVHHGYAVGQLRRDADVMRDEDHGHPAAPLYLAQQDEDLNLHGRVKCGGEFVRQQEIRTTGESQSDESTLAHAARKFVQIGFEAALGRRGLHHLQKFERTRARSRLPHDIMTADSFDDLITDAVDRIKCKSRILKTIAILFPRTAFNLRRVIARRSSPSSRTCPLTCVRRRGRSWMIVRSVTSCRIPIRPTDRGPHRA
jgi:hypothetical protein